MKNFFIIIIFIFMFGCVSNEYNSIEKDPIIGCWYYTTAGQESWVVLNQDKTFYFTAFRTLIPGTWSRIDDNTISLNYLYNGEEYTSKIIYHNNTKTIYIDGAQNTIYMKVKCP